MCFSSNYMILYWSENPRWPKLQDKYKFEDTKEIRNSKSKKDGQYNDQRKDRQYNGKKKKDRLYNGQKKKDRKYTGQKKKDRQYTGQKKNKQYNGQKKRRIRQTIVHLRQKTKDSALEHN